MRFPALSEPHACCNAVVCNSVHHYLDPTTHSPARQTLQVWFGFRTSMNLNRTQSPVLLGSGSRFTKIGEPDQKSGSGFGEIFPRTGPNRTPATLGLSEPRIKNCQRNLVSLSKFGLLHSTPGHLDTRCAFRTNQNANVAHLHIFPSLTTMSDHSGRRILSYLMPFNVMGFS